MKKIIAFILVLPLALSLCACSRASQIPSLAEIAENGAEWGGEQIQQVQGCTLADLEKAWGKTVQMEPGQLSLNSQTIILKILLTGQNLRGFPMIWQRKSFLKIATTNTISVGYIAIMLLFTMRMAVKKM